MNTPDTVYIDIETELSKSSFISLVSKLEVENLLEKKGKRYQIYSISKILFDSSGENAIFHFLIRSRPKQFSMTTVLIKKIFGRWIIVESFDFVMT